MALWPPDVLLSRLAVAMNLPDTDLAGRCRRDGPELSLYPSRNVPVLKSGRALSNPICVQMVDPLLPPGRRSRTAVAPLERLKILMQVQGNQKVYTGVWQGLKHMARTEGLRGMMKGNLANCIRIVPNSAVKFLTYEQLSRCAAASKHITC